ncbi:MAG: hypothetical protein SWX82_10255 [Cyanobacteriota bacterium]|nr:hypothetical protein [Cyanobacteriota bacterium]
MTDEGSSNVFNRTNIQDDVNFIHLNKEYTQRILTQIEQIKGKITQFFTVKESMDELDKIFQLYPISGFDEAQATIGIMIDIEKRHYLIEKLVSFDRRQG